MTALRKPKTPQNRAQQAQRASDTRPRLRTVEIETGLPPITSIQNELDDMRDVLVGRAPSPIDKGVLTLMEVASAYHARTLEMIQLIQRAEQSGAVRRGSPYYHLRTGELRTFAEIAKAAADLGSRRLSSETLIFDQARYGRDL